MTSRNEKYMVHTISLEDEIDMAVFAFLKPMLLFRQLNDPLYIARCAQFKRPERNQGEQPHAEGVAELAQPRRHEGASCSSVNAKPKRKIYGPHYFIGKQKNHMAVFAFLKPM